MTYLLTIFSKIKSYSMVILAIMTGIFYLLWKRVSKKNAALTDAVMSLTEINASSAEAVKTKEKQDKIIRKTNEKINTIQPKYKYSDDNK